MNEQPTRRRIDRRIVVAVVVLTIPAVAAVASDRFGDVPSDHVFHDDIAWLADQGITRGCNPPTNDEFCPDDPVTRGQMAAFMHRLADNLGNGGTTSRVSGTHGPPRLLTEEAWTTLVSTTISAPSAGAVLVDGGASLFVENASDSGGAGLIAATADQSCSDSMTASAATWATATLAGVDSAAVSGLLPVPEGTTTIRLCGWAVHVNTFERTEAVAPSVSAVWFPSSQASLLAEGADTSIPEIASRLRDRAKASAAD